ncbi:hypothetical protein HWC99_gp20 [Flavobacterium phage vB_FspS_tant8-1]|uniref:Uncharacterized protein n=1 Tax=Flavobacterium phage vB_FspS_tant8-1 TaxID=2686278 RepID=A0A6B9LNN9_9CAUD|nr:hypothetical protein HWC99_gp20 [Flavobacterium phage vB_FspS_tant8-1]QHB40951.1 hypothetical protein tant81_gp020 [Flavobacterium phage vB_FspS_tant8-1]
MKVIEKRKLLVEMIELMIFCGYDITNHVGRPLSYFDFEKVQQFIEVLKKEKNEIDS